MTHEETRERDLVAAGLEYLQRGWRVVPIPVNTKGPTSPRWQHLRLDAATMPKAFRHHVNIGIILGEPSGGLVDVDLDCDEAIELADQYLPPTPAVTGRLANPRSHRWYICAGATTQQHADPTDRRKIVELRSTGGQTLVGPSCHPDEGDEYDRLTAEPATITTDELSEAVLNLACAVIARRHGANASSDYRARRTRKPATQTLGPAPATSPDRDKVMRRAVAYLDKLPAAVSGQGGHSATYTAATALVHGFELTESEALALLESRYNPRCDPPWKTRELEHKVRDAATKHHDRPRGYLLNDRPQEHNGVNLDAFYIGPTPPPAAPETIEEPSSPEETPLDPGELPDDLLKVPGFIADVMEHNLATAHRQQPTLALAGAICLQALLCARKVMDERGNRTNLYAICLASSGAGKDHARKVNKNILEAAGLGALEGPEIIASDAGLMTAVSAQPAILFQLDEFGRWLKHAAHKERAPQFIQDLLTAFMTLYTSADTTVKGKGYADETKNRTINQPCAIVLATSTPDNFKQSLTVDSMADGLVARFMVFETNSLPPLSDAIYIPIPKHIIDCAKWWGTFSPGGNLASINPSPLIVVTDADAGRIFKELSTKCDEQNRNTTREDVKSIWSRTTEKARRLALVYACSRDHREPYIDAEAATWACRLSEHMTRRVLWIAHEHVADGVFDAKQKAVLRVIRKAGGTVTRNQLCRGTRTLSQRERDEIINNLLETSQIISEQSAAFGRPAVVYRLNAA